MKSIIVLALLARAAAAEPYYPYAASPGPAPEPEPFVDRGYIGGGAGLTVDHFFNAFLDVEGGLRLGTLPLWARGAAAFGASADVEGGGAYRMLRAGLETRTCSSDAACFFLGADIGYQTQVWSKQDEMTEHHSGIVFGPRFGLDVGGEQTRFRLAVEAYRYAHTSDAGVLDDVTHGGGLSLAVVHRM